MARYMSPQIQDLIAEKLEAWLGLKLNRQKSRIVNLRRNQERLEFLGYQIGLAPNRRPSAI
jgi:RNA-directed DNA polymerase